MRRVRVANVAYGGAPPHNSRHAPKSAKIFCFFFPKKQFLLTYQQEVSSSFLKKRTKKLFCS